MNKVYIVNKFYKFLRSVQVFSSICPASLSLHTLLSFRYLDKLSHTKKNMWCSEMVHIKGSEIFPVSYGLYLWFKIYYITIKEYFLQLHNQMRQSLGENHCDWRYVSSSFIGKIKWKQKNEKKGQHHSENTGYNIYRIQGN